MTFVSRVDYAEHDTFEHVAVIRPPLEVDKNLNYVFVMGASLHNLDFELIVDPYRYPNIHDLAKAIIKHNAINNNNNNSNSI